MCLQTLTILHDVVLRYLPGTIDNYISILYPRSKSGSESYIAFTLSSRPLVY